MQRDVGVVVGGFSAAIAFARATDFVATIPERHTRCLRFDMLTFELPFEVPSFTVSLLWHPRQDSDPPHRWLRARIREVCAPPARSGLGPRSS